MLDHINLMRGAEIYNLPEGCLLMFDDIDPLRNGCLGKSGDGANNVLRVVHEELTETDRTSVTEQTRRLVAPRMKPT